MDKKLLFVGLLAYSGLGLVSCVSEEPKSTSEENKTEVTNPKVETPSTQEPNIKKGLIAYYSFDKQNADNATGDTTWDAELWDGNREWGFPPSSSGQKPEFVEDTPSGNGYALKGAPDKSGSYWYEPKNNPAAGQTQLSMAMWYKGLKDNQRLYILRSGVTSQNLLKIEDGMLQGTISVWDQSTYFKFDTDLREILLDGLWHHVVVVYKSKDYKLYIDGKLIAVDTKATMVDIPKDRGQFGRNESTIDEFRFYNRELRPEEVKMLFDQKV